MILLKPLSFVCFLISVGFIVGCGTKASTNKGKVEIKTLPLEPLDFMTDISHHQNDLYKVLEKNSKVETNQETLAYEGALFRILQTSNSGKYGGARRLIDKYKIEYPGDSRLEFQLGVQQFRLGRFDQAAPYFEKLLTNESTVLKEAAQFFLAATYSGYDKKRATALLNEISSNPKHSFAEKATAIIDSKK